MAHDEVDELAGCEAWRADAQRRVDRAVAELTRRVNEGVAEVARRMADRDDAERALRAAQARDRDL